MDNSLIINLAEKYGTPLYITDLDIVEKNYRKIESSFKKYFNKLKIFYAMKANYNPFILKLLKSLGSGIDAASPYEFILAEKIGFNGKDISFAPPNASKEELNVASIYGVDTLILDSLDMLENSKGLRFKNYGVRINPSIEAGFSEKVMTGKAYSKFGVDISSFNKLIEKSKEIGIEINGLHAHIGSGILDEKPYSILIDKMTKIFDNLSKKDFIDIGGGFGYNYMTGEHIDTDKIASVINDKFPYDKELRIEPGRYLVVNASILISRVNGVKEIDGRKKYVQIDAGMNSLIRPALYNAFHRIKLLNENGDIEEKYDVVGPICESDDYIALDVRLKRPKVGDYIAILDVGAYGISMASNYNLRPIPAEVILKKNNVVGIRERDSLENIVGKYKGLDNL
ncbi:MAG: diaminopimelate decarboxylase [Caldisphaera sp.]|uniref:diaminopimelate decarboxylase n=1 Tax=Caldisphaera sp. TaxID=2060322 RepID=UPI003D0CE243